MSDELRPEEFRIRDLLIKRGGYTDEELEELRELAAEVTSLQHESWHRSAKFRMNIELIVALKRFDKASDRLGTKILILTVVAVIATLVQATVAVLGYYWPRH